MIDKVKSNECMKVRIDESGFFIWCENYNIDKDDMHYIEEYQAGN